MKKLYVTYSIEYEKGWGSKPDGLVISEDYNTLITHIEPYNKREKGSYELFWNYTPPEEIWCTDEDFDMMRFENGLMFAESFNIMSFTFYKKLS